MFDLDREVRTWSESVHAGGCNTARMAELMDHLHCEIDRERAAGLTDEQAFAAAVARVGPANQLSAEHAKNRSLLGTLCAAQARDARRYGGRGREILVAHGILWASLMIATSILASKGEGTRASEWVLLFVLVPGWWVSEQIVRRALRFSPKDGSK